MILVCWKSNFRHPLRMCLSISGEDREWRQRMRQTTQNLVAGDVVEFLDFVPNT